MEDQVERLVEKTWKIYQDTPQDCRVLIAVAGIPGSGKTSLAAAVTARINKLVPAMQPVATFVPMDGYHLTRAQLSAMPDPQRAHAWRGAAFTFNAPAFLQLLRRVREPLTADTPTIYAPSFDHAIKDPVENDIGIPATARIVIFEGNYLSLQKGEWAEISKIVDESWFVEVENGVARERLAKRHVAAGIVDTIEKGRERADKYDLMNGKEINEHRGPVDEVILSREDDAWKPQR